MGGSTKQTSTTDSTTKTDPYGPTIPAVGNLINYTNAAIPNIGPTGTEQSAFAGLMGNAQAGNPYAPAINGLASNLLAGGGPDRSGFATSGLSSLQNSLNPIANQSTNPYDNQAFNQLRGTLTNDITDQIKSQYAGAGYGSGVTTGDFGQQLGRGISQGIAPAFVQAQDTLTNQKANAANSLYGAGNATAGLLSGLDQTKLANQQAGIGASTAALQANDSPYQQMLAVSQQQRNLPLQNQGNIESLLLPMAQLGGTSNTNATTTGQTQVPLAQQIMGGAIGGAGLLGGMGAFGPTGWLLSGAGAGAAGAGAAGGLGSLAPLLMMSDARLKDDIEQVGALYDGTPVYRFRYKGEPRTQIGLMAQDVEKYAPDAVHEINGFKAVDYKKATERAMGIA